MNRKDTGKAYEMMAARYLEEKGHQILARNYRIRSGEIDLITKDQEYIVFTEVKYRRNMQNGSGQEAVNRQKQRTIIQTAKYFLLVHGYPEEVPCRFDVIAISGHKITHIENAFEV